MNKIKTIRTEDDYQAALAMLESLIDQNPEPDTEIADQLDVLSVLVDKYESETFPQDLPSAIDAIKFCMEQKDLKPVDLVPYIGSKSRVSEILSGKRNLTVDMIRSLEEGLGIPAKALLRKSEDTEESVFQAWDRKLFSEMQKRDYFEVALEGADDMTSTLKNFFGGVNAPKRVHALLRQSNYRSAPTTDSLALVAWSTRVLKEAKTINLKNSYSKGSIDLDYMKAITSLSIEPDGPVKAKNKLADSGIILIIESHLPKTRLDGAAFMFNGETPVIGMTLRHDRPDNFWFTLMHEIAHISLHLDGSGVDSFFDELDDIKGSELSSVEKEADALASESLIPASKWVVSPARLIPSPLAAKSLANDAGVDISIVAGKIRYESGNWSYLNSLISGRTVSDLFDKNETQG
ncbi:MAG: ImmA/IrrE family metallo-endopeptidase [Candidatus Saccharimonadia bacterium]